MSSDQTSERIWRVFYSKPRTEKKAEGRLRDSGFDVFCPIRTAIRQWSDRKKMVEEPLFPGYIFGHVTERERLDVLQDDAVVRCVSFGGTMAAVPQVEIDQLKLLQDSPERLEVIERRAFPIGSEVYIDSGPLKGVRGHIIDRPKAHYLVVDVPSIRQSVRVHIPAEWVRRPSGFD